MDAEIKALYKLAQNEYGKENCVIRNDKAYVKMTKPDGWPVEMRICDGSDDRTGKLVFDTMRKKKFVLGHKNINKVDKKKAYDLAVQKRQDQLEKDAGRVKSKAMPRTPIKK